MEKLLDPFGRVHDYLRISVTDRCNLRCIYCMPKEGMAFQPEETIMSFEEIAEVAAALSPLGLKKLRITGGEPLVRKGIDKLIHMLSTIPGIEDIAMTTNGLLLAKQADSLKKAGLNRLNISLDSLRPDRFAMITRGGDVNKVLNGIRAAVDAGFEPIKLNVVLMKGINDDEILDFLKLTLHSPLNVRFIEYMPIGESSDQWRRSYIPLSRVTEVCTHAGFEYAPVSIAKSNGPSENLRITGAAGTFGLIHPVSDHFCDTCNRLRLTADGHIKACLYWSDELNVRSFTRQQNPEAIRRLFLQALGGKPKNHEMALALDKIQQSHTPTKRRMSQIGG